jgi:hypothetical protein
MVAACVMVVFSTCVGEEFESLVADGPRLEGDVLLLVVCLCCRPTMMGFDGLNRTILPLAIASLSQQCLKTLRNHESTNNDRSYKLSERPTTTSLKPSSTRDAPSSANDAGYENWSVTVHLFRLDQNKCCCVKAPALATGR